MRVVLLSDEPYRVHAVLRAELERRGHSILALGAVADGAEHAWAEVAEAGARAIVDGHADEGVFCCWTGTGISMAANKVPGIRAALCADPPTAAAARVWNHANVLCLSNRTLSDDLAKELLAAWFDTEPGSRGADGVARLAEVETRTLSKAQAR